jgi:hypothetical protein
MHSQENQLLVKAYQLPHREPEFRAIRAPISNRVPNL